jgi:hypothetical protein
MQKIYKVILTVLFILISTCIVRSQNNFFSDINESAIANSAGKREIIPQKFRTVVAGISQLKNFLWNLPIEKNITNTGQTPIIELPMPDGRMARFHVWQSAVMHAALEAKFPEMKTFAGTGIDDPYASVRLDYNPYFGFHAQILSAKGNVYIDPFAKWDKDHYISYYSQDNKRDIDFACKTVTRANPSSNIIDAGPCRGTQLYTYRLALACTGEYAVAVCAPGAPTVPATAAAMLTSVNRVTGVYEKELSIRLILVPNNNTLIYLDGTTDPYTNDDGLIMLDENQANVDLLIGPANYDIGHVFSTGGGGIAGLGVVCEDGAKAWGVTGLTFPVGDNFDIDYVAHEMGHEFGGDHPFNSTSGACGGGNRNAATAYEVGSGTSIMAYAGICGANDIQPHSDPFMHSISFDQISTYVSGTGGTCPVKTPTGNTLPVITAMNNNGANIPFNTPFTLTATATDADGDPLTYNWEEWDLGPATTWNGGALNTSSPIFKSRIPKTNGSRTFPDMAVILAGYPANPPAVMNGLKGETLPLVARDIKFRLTVRDVHTGTPVTGGIVTGGSGCQAGFTTPFVLHVINTGAPFAVTVPNGGESYPGGSTQTITWNVVGSNAAPINCSNVMISMSIDGGLTYPTVLTASTPNDGSEPLIIPVGLTSTARIKVEAVGNVFFDISNANFSVTAAAAGFDFVTGSFTASTSCGVETSSAISLGTTSTLGYAVPINLSASGNPLGTTVSFSVNPVIPGNSTIVTLNNTNVIAAGTYNILVTGISGAITQSKTISFVINPGTGPAINIQPTGQVVCVGSGATFSVTSAAATGYQWQESTNGGTTWNNIATATGSTYTIPAVTIVQNNYQYRCLVTGQCNTTTSAAVILTVNTVPAITQQPSNAAVCAGNSVSFTAAASGTGAGYQWQVSTNGGATWNNIPSATAATYTFLTALADNNNQYRCVATGSCSPGAISTAATLIVGSTLIINTQPVLSVICAGGTAAFNIGVTGTVTYQWQESTNGGGAWNNIANGGIYSGVATATLTLTGAPASANNNLYRCVVSGNCPSINSLAVSLTVNTAPAITAQPVAGSTICAGQNTSLTLAATGTAISYQWQISTDIGATYTNLINGPVYSNVGTATLNITAAIASMNTYRYRCVITGTCSPAAISTASVLTVYTPASVTANPVNVTVCENSNASFSISAAGTSPVYQWQVSTNGGASYSNVANGGVYLGATTATLTLVGIPFNFNNNLYRCLVTGLAPCGFATSVAGILNINPIPFAFTVTGGGAYCVGNNGVPVGLSVSTVGINYQLVLNGVNTGVPLAGTGGPLNFGNKTTAGIYTVVAYNVATGCTQPMAGSVTVTVNPLPTISLSVSPYKNLYPGLVTTLTATATSTANPIIYFWFKNNSLISNTGSTLPVNILSLGDYKVAITDANGCVNQSPVITIADSANSKFFIYPNPNNGQFTVAYYNQGGLSTKQLITIFSSKGERVYNNVFAVNLPYQLLTIDLRRHGAGIYYVVLSDETGKKIKTGEVLVR